ncbi:hypothetical protein [Streptomyces formicae]|uniref:Gram-positive cocci surface proteins LPxTG domain-containing protein n=1 Tax=Streptomyces formicae TaxID=1616117 RepID=A0A291QCE7_9ACTN|nr:hypothetical protein [Streptomyces formicae]ATL29186.1 hypothetical protein KY5_4168c [Streptomyces formicae]
MRATRRTFRTAAIATGAIAALAVPATAAFASDATPPNPQGQVTPGDQTGKDQSDKDRTDQDKTNPDENTKKDETGKDETGQDKSKDKDTSKDKDNETPKPGSWESKGTTALGKGWTAKVDVNASARTAKAALSLNGTPKGSLTAYAKSATTTIDGNTFTLSPEGTITMKAKPTPPKPVDKRVFVRDAKLADGSLAKIYKLGPNHYQADIYAHGAKLDTLDANGRSASGQNNGLHVTLNPDGTIKSWVEGRTHHNGTTPQPKKDSHQVVPKGGVKAGAEGVGTGSSDDAPLIAAGSGMAAVGAAGLGFALYRRKQNG